MLGSKIEGVSSLPKDSTLDESWGFRTELETVRIPDNYNHKCLVFQENTLLYLKFQILLHFPLGCSLALLIVEVGVQECEENFLILDHWMHLEDQPL